MMINAYMKKKETSQINSLTLHINELKTGTKPKVNRMEELTKIRWEINHQQKTIEKIDETVGFLKTQIKCRNLLLD